MGGGLESRSIITGPSLDTFLGCRAVKKLEEGMGRGARIVRKIRKMFYIYIYIYMQDKKGGIGQKGKSDTKHSTV